MKKNSNIYNDEIDLINIFKIIWYGKMKILSITIISCIVGFGYYLQIPKDYLNSLNIKSYKDNEFLKINNIEKLLNINKSDNELYLTRFIREILDYEEFLANIKNEKKIQEHLSKFNNKDQEIELFKYTNLLRIDEPKDNEEYYTLVFKWDDPEKAKKILQDTLNLTSNNLKTDIDNELKDTFEFEKKLLLNKDEVRLNYLKEQSAIARELKIQDNQIDNVNLSQSSVSLSINTADIAYYLRGYKAIDKEIELIQNRYYPNLRHIEEEMNNIKDMEFNFVDYNVYLMKTQSVKNTKLILMTFILLGLTIGVFFVLISNAFQFRTTSKKT